MKKQNVVSKRRPRQNILSLILGSAKAKTSNGSSSTSNTSASRASSSRSNTRTDQKRHGSKLIQSAVELTRRSKSARKKNRHATFLKGSRAFYRGPKGIEKVTVVGVHHDSKLEPYYTIKFGEADGCKVFDSHRGEEGDSRGCGRERAARCFFGAVTIKQTTSRR